MVGVEGGLGLLVCKPHCIVVEYCGSVSFYYSSIGALVFSLIVISASRFNVRVQIRVLAVIEKNRNCICLG